MLIVEIFMNVVIILVWGGSKCILWKNFCFFCNKFIIVWFIEVVLVLKEFDKVIVSIDDDEIV